MTFSLNHSNIQLSLSPVEPPITLEIKSGTWTSQWLPTGLVLYQAETQPQITLTSSYTKKIPLTHDICLRDGNKLLFLPTKGRTLLSPILVDSQTIVLYFETGGK